jgi:hypothetical protein
LGSQNANVGFNEYPSQDIGILCSIREITPDWIVIQNRECQI